MSVPERSVPPRTAPITRPPAGRPSPQPRRIPARSPLAPERELERKAARPAGRRVSLGFIVLATSLFVASILGLVSLNALLAQNQFRIELLSERMDTLAGRNGELQRQAAHLSAPGRVATWARRTGMRLPDDPHILHVGGAGSDGQAGADTSGGRITGSDGGAGGLAAPPLGADELAVKAALEGVR